MRQADYAAERRPGDCVRRADRDAQRDDVDTANETTRHPPEARGAASYEA